MKIGHAEGADECGLPDSLVSRYNVAFGVDDRANYVAYRYNNWIQVCGAGGGNRVLRSVLNHLHDRLGL